MVEAGESKYSRVLKIRKLLISRPAKSAVYAKMGGWLIGFSESFCLTAAHEERIPLS
jgi:hypothetical protein